MNLPPFFPPAPAPQAFGKEALLSALDAVERRLSEAAEAQQANPQGAAWWKLREAALLALGSVSQHLEEVALSERGGGGK